MDTEQPQDISPDETRLRPGEVERRIIQVESQLTMARRARLVAEAALEALGTVAPERQVARAVGKCFVLSTHSRVEDQLRAELVRSEESIARLSELKSLFEKKLAPRTVRSEH
ncbi:hypothetical protein CYME_CMQ131C [Cyanidioschyzon merolae strain 10D]|uniref:Uncharacterized protein n=1 Tax=Cyanidioschyzon merolae (strain NIES-3377 / 10D) TaxID=280699 RepID=M1VAC6_CYAM1|nr:hypothetical protein CYME_CMQ131C [Cyanidioschyzon merolae strain 10D]BAM82039.1 hypothetical protein CYME_CMQ131C [Cyanidioschyzon merolae strain 10D]|eukprot:XP_005538075.1 hypothetical protein CYME_CMQ131C [Cyanidioschyzon merolae strain 10D]